MGGREDTRLPILEVNDEPIPDAPPQQEYIPLYPTATGKVHRFSISSSYSDT